MASGARISHRGEVPADTKGYFYAPTVLHDVPTNSPILREVIFGPIAPIVTWSNETDLLDMVNDSELGLASYIYSRDLQRAIVLAEALDAGMGRHQPRHRLRPVDTLRRLQAEWTRSRGSPPRPRSPPANTISQHRLA